MHSHQPPGVVQNWSAVQCSKKNTEQCGYDHAPVTRGRMRAQFLLPHGPLPQQMHDKTLLLLTRLLTQHIVLRILQTIKWRDYHSGANVLQCYRLIEHLLTPTFDAQCKRAARDAKVELISLGNQLSRA